MNRKMLRKLVDESFEWAVEKRHALHRIPEEGFKEFKTQKAICEALDELGIPYTTERTWVVGLIEGALPGRTIALRAEMDALPVTEPKGLPYRSQHDGWMHACGHDIHMAIQLGAARILNHFKDQLHGNVKLLFQPAEETEGGGKPMVNAGVLENPHVDACYGLHVQSRLPLGTVETRSGTLNASTDEIRLDILGRGGHAAYPESSVDAIVIAAQIVTALQTLVSRNVSPLNSVVLSFGIVQGGTAENVICDHVILEGTLRTTDPKQRIFAITRIDKIARSVAEALGGNSKLTVTEGYAPLVNHSREAELVLDIARELYGNVHVITKDAPSMGGEDFSYFIEETPGAFYHIGCTSADRMPAPPLHNKNFAPNEECIRQGIEMQAAIVLRETGTEI